LQLQNFLSVFLQVLDVRGAMMEPQCEQEDGF